MEKKEDVFETPENKSQTTVCLFRLLRPVLLYLTAVLKSWNIHRRIMNFNKTIWELEHNSCVCRSSPAYSPMSGSYIELNQESLQKIICGAV